MKAGRHPIEFSVSKLRFMQKQLDRASRKLRKMRIVQGKHAICPCCAKQLRESQELINHTWEILGDEIVDQRRW